MMGLTRTASWPSSSATSTGQHRSCRQLATSCAAQSGPSSSEMKPACPAVNSRWVPTNDARAATSRGVQPAAPPGAQLVVFCTRTPTTTSRGSRPGRGVTLTVPASSQRVRTSRPTRRPASNSSSTSRPPGTPTRSRCCPVSGSPRSGISRATASWKAIQRAPSTSSSSTSTQAEPVHRSTTRDCTCRNRRNRSRQAGPRDSRTTSVDSCGASPSPARAAPSGPRTPNCQRIWFFDDDAR